MSLEATISPVVQGGCTVEFRTFDVDDPFDQNNAGMPNVGVIDNDTIEPVQVDAADPHQARVFYHVEPPSASLASATFTAPGTVQTATNLPLDFDFPFDQGDVVNGTHTISLEGTSADVTCMSEFTVSKTGVVAPEKGTIQEIAIFRIPFENGLFPILVTHSIFGRFSFLCYEINRIPGSKTLWFGFGSVNIETEQSTEIPTVIAGWAERLIVTDNSGEIASGIMVDVTVPTIPAQGPNFRSKDLWLDAWAVSNNGITAVGRIDTIIFTDAPGSTNAYYPGDILSINIEVDLPLEENGHVPTICP